jgi:RNAse (barnase) inhibitor barstar
VSESERPAGWPQRGVHRVLGQADSVSAELARRGWNVAGVPSVRTDDALWDGLADALALPEWFGRNLDALDEALADRAVPTAVVLAGWTAYARAQPARWARLLAVLQARADQDGPPFVVLLTD